MKVRFHFLLPSSPERWERSIAWSTNNGEEVRRGSDCGLWSPTICSSSLSRFLTDSEHSVLLSLSKYPASRHLVGRTSWRGGRGLPRCNPVSRQGAQWSAPYLKREGLLGTGEGITWLGHAGCDSHIPALQPLLR